MEVLSFTDGRFNALRRGSFYERLLILFEWNTQLVVLQNCAVECPFDLGEVGGVLGCELQDKLAELIEQISAIRVLLAPTIGRVP